VSASDAERRAQRAEGERSHDSSELGTRLRLILGERYHHRHPFNVRLHGGACTPAEVQRWIRNRYYYQTRIPLKDGLILTKSEDREFRRGWIRRIHDHDGDDARAGGLELWLRLAEAAGLERAEVASLRGVLPGVRRACDAYVEFVASHDLLASVASSLTELSAGPFLGARAEAFRKHYGWIEEAGLEYFLSRTTQAPRDAAEGLAYVLTHAKTAEDQERCTAALTRKCEILWALLDGVEWGGRVPRLAPAALLRPEGDETLVVLPERAVRVSASGRAILAACDGRRDVEAVAAAIRTEHPTGERVERDVYEFIERMEPLGVLRLSEGDK
jgi:pyrroloquinoline-quinone synthase